MLIIIMGVLTCLIFFIGVENLFVKNIKYRLEKIKEHLVL